VGGWDVQALQRLNPESRNRMAWNAGLRGALEPKLGTATRSRAQRPEPTDEQITRVDRYFEALPSESDSD
jgi:hypothetical protein